VRHRDAGEEHGASERPRHVDVVRARCQGDGVRTARVRGRLGRDRAAPAIGERDDRGDPRAGEGRGARDGRVVEGPRDGEVQAQRCLARRDRRGAGERISIESGDAAFRGVVRPRQRHSVIPRNEERGVRAEVIRRRG